MRYPIGCAVRLNIYDVPQQNAGWNVVGYEDGAYIVQDCADGQRMQVLEFEIEERIAVGSPVNGGTDAPR